ncbi:hypothetical protein [Photobacterium aquae]|uniref:hypothetical protein n=1 Tax=Photobacterium aquae TaxID=1195763 RepID=UPI00069E6125|nr:hypothetical protein [Photobacterium aquae]
MQNSLHNRTSRLSALPSMAQQFMKYSLPLMLAALFAIAPQVRASDAATDTVANQKETIYRINTLQRDLSSIRQQTLKAHPELTAQAKAFELAYHQKAEQVGYNPDEFIAKAKELQTALRNDKLSEEERSSMIRDFAAAKQAMADKREAIIADKALTEMQDKLMADTYAAMKEFDPKTESLTKELNELLHTLDK